MDLKSSREQFLRDLSCTLKETQEWTRDVLNRIGWTQEHLLQKDVDLVVCPYDVTHRVPASRLERHAADCSLFVQGYTAEQVEKMREPDHFCDKTTLVETIHIDNDSFTQILESVNGNIGFGDRKMPLTAERATTDLSREERLAVHQYCITKAKESAKPTTVPEDGLMLLEEEKLEEQPGRTMSEQRAVERDLKRRRATYRGKSTHTTNKSHREILKDVIDNQMNLLTRIWNQDKGDTKESRDVIQGTSSPRPRHSDRGDYHRPQPMQRSRSRSPRSERSRSPRPERSRSPRPERSRSPRLERSPRPDRSRSQHSARRRSRSPASERLKSARHSSADRADNTAWPPADRPIKEEDAGSEKRHKHKKQKHKHRKKHKRSRSRERSSSEERPIKQEDA